MSEKPIIEINKPGHIVVLDQSWHKVFEGKKTFKMKQLENKLNKLLQEQGKVNTEYDGYKNLKRKMMDEIVANMGDETQSAGDKNKKNSRYIKEINNKFNRYEQRKSELPKEIEAINKELLTVSMMQCYKTLMDSKEKSKVLEQSIKAMKTQLKDKVGEKEDVEQAISSLYNFMHDVAGFEVIEMLDEHYFGGKK